MQSEPIYFEHAVLLDVQGLFGGRDLWLAADGQAFCRIVRVSGAELQTARYSFTIPPEELARLNELLEQNDFFSLKTPDRYGVPDEARPVLYAEAGGKTHAVAKWANDVHTEFDNIYAFLVRLANAGSQGAPLADGDREGKWPPLDFPASKTLVERSDPVLDG